MEAGASVPSVLLLFCLSGHIIVPALSNGDRMKVAGVTEYKLCFSDTVVIAHAKFLRYCWSRKRLDWYAIMVGWGHMHGCWYRVSMDG
jgi:hypothetical protein